MRTYVIEQCGGKWCLYNKAKTRILGKHDTKEQAQEQEQAIKAQEGYTIKDREIFAVGKHNGDTYTEADLDEMVRAYNELDFLPAVKLGHSKEIGAPAYGYLRNVRKVGAKLLADITDLPKDIYDAIITKRYGRVSAEVFWNLSRAGKIYKRAIGALALLGQEIPGVAGLKPLYEHSMAEDSAAKCYEFAIDENMAIATGDGFKPTGNGDNNGDTTMPEDIKAYQEKVDALTAQVTALQAAASTGNDEAKAYAKQLSDLQETIRVKEAKEKAGKLAIPALRNHLAALYEIATKQHDVKVKLYSETDKKESDVAIVDVLDQMVAYVNEKTAHLFKEAAQGDGKRDEGYDDAGEEVHKRTQKYMADNKCNDYKVAQAAVLSADAELKAAYAVSSN